MGWPLVVNTDGVFLPVYLGIIGLTLPAGLAGEVNTEIKRREIGVPIIAIPGTASRWVFLVEPPTGPVPRLPIGVGLMVGATHIPLPPTTIDGGPVRWICEPGTGSYTCLNSSQCSTRFDTSPTPGHCDGPRYDRLVRLRTPGDDLTLRPLEVGRLREVLAIAIRASEHVEADRVQAEADR